MIIEFGEDNFHMKWRGKGGRCSCESAANYYEIDDEDSNMTHGGLSKLSLFKICALLIS